MKKPHIAGIVSIVLLVVLALPTLNLNANAGLFQSPVPPPPNDDFDSATVITGLPFEEAVNTELATVEEGEPMPPCAYEAAGRTVWYSFTPDRSVSLSAYTWDAWFSYAVAAYSGDSLAALTYIGSRCWWGPLTFRAEAGTTYYLQVRGVWNEGGPLRFHLETTPPPQADFGFYPGDPSVFEDVRFYDNSWDPGEMGIEAQAWDLGDGTSATGCCPVHRYAAAGDYTVQLTVTTVDGRTASVPKTVPVRTHDVAAVKFSAPQAAKAGQTRPIMVGIRNKVYPEWVQVELYRSVPSGFDHVGGLRQYVPVRSGGRTTDFKFSYTFTPEDASLGKVTFKAVAYIIDTRDALPADNEAISSPTKVSR